MLLYTFRLRGHGAPLCVSHNNIDDTYFSNCDDSGLSE